MPTGSGSLGLLEGRRAAFFACFLITELTVLFLTTRNPAREKSIHREA